MMWSIWNAPSDRDYYDQFCGLEPEPEDDRCVDCGAHEEQACEFDCLTRRLATEEDIDGSQDA